MNFGNFWGMFKTLGNINFVTWIILIFELLAFISIVRKKENRNLFVWIIFIFAWANKLFSFLRKAISIGIIVPQILLFVPVIIFILEQERNKKLWLSLFIIVYILPMVGFQTVHSIATGNGEWNYRRKIGLYLDSIEKDKNQWIF
jgi:hypothetical protein